MIVGAIWLKFEIGTTKHVSFELPSRVEMCGLFRETVILARSAKEAVDLKATHRYKLEIRRIPSMFSKAHLGMFDFWVAPWIPFTESPTVDLCLKVAAGRLQQLHGCRQCSQHDQWCSVPWP